MRLGTVLRTAAGVAGVGLLGVAVRYTAERSVDIRPVTWVRWWVTAALVHDLIVAPLAIAVGWVVVRSAPRALKAPLQMALLVSAVLVAVSWPALRGYGRVPSNPTYLPRDYTSGLLISLAAVWAVGAAWAVTRLLRGHSDADAG